MPRRSGVATGSLLADVAHLLFEHAAIELGERQARQELDAPLQDVRDPAELAELLLITALGQRWVFDTPMRGDRLPRPDGTHFPAGVVTHREHEIHDRRIGL